MLIVIADDITGAAEIAGVALRHGLKTTLSIGLSDIPEDSDLWVIATDTRSESEAHAINTIKTITDKLKRSGNIIFKKTDSVLRGHITAELLTIMNVMGFRHTMLIPQNPSKRRIIYNGRYYVDGIPLDKTSFSYDPEFPARTSSVKALLNDEHIRIVAPTDELDLHENGTLIYVAEATDNIEIDKQIDKTDDSFLFAGGADFFNALLNDKNHHSSNANTQTSKIKLPEHTIIVCGSTQSEDLSEKPFIKKSGTHVATMPTTVFNGAPPDEWITSVAHAYASHKSAVISIGQSENKGAAYALRLKNIMAETVRCSVAIRQPEMLIIEGGATAFAVIQALGWNTFMMKNEYAPGIVGMTHGNTEIILKPGSYPWDEALM